MPGRAKSKTAKSAEERRGYDALMAHAVRAYRAELEKPENGCRRRGLRTICKDFEDIYYHETGKQIKLVHSTLNKLADGGRTKVQAGAERSWLDPPEVETVITFITENAGRGFPDSKRRIKEHVDLVLRARLGELFPPLGVGKNWVARFVTRHANRLKMADSRPLEDKRGRGANPVTNDAWYRILKDGVDHYKIRIETTFTADEIGVQNRGEERERVVTSRNHKGPQYQQRAGTRDNTTVIVTICADGTSTPPAVIFKGSAYQASWAENNPLNAS